MKKNIKWNKIEMVAIPVIIASLLIGGTAFASGTNRKDGLNSHGAVDVTSTEGSILIDSADLVTIADEIDTLEATYKSTTKAALNKIGTYINPDGSVTHNVPSDQLAAPTFDQLASAIENSQSSSSAINDLSGETYYRSEHGSLQKASDGGSGEPLSLAPATADNLSAGTVAYVDGKLLLGTGADNCTYYNQGFTDGYAQQMEGMDIEYTYHQHTNDCYADCTVKSIIGGYSGPGKVYTMCPYCEAYGYMAVYEGKTVLYTCGAYEYVATYLSCFNCNGGIHYSYKLNHASHKCVVCGKDDSTIESAKIIFK